MEYAENTQLDDLSFIDINIEESPEVESEFNVKLVPSFAFFKKGKLYQSIQPTNEEDLLSFINEIEGVANV